MWGGSPNRNMVSAETGIPATWNVKTGENIKWAVTLGSPTYAAPVIAGGRIFIGTNNKALLRQAITGDKGVMLCLAEDTGKFLWQATHDKLPSGSVNDWPEQGIPSAPYVEGDRLYYVSNRCELVCADTRGFLDGENDGPYTKEKHKDRQDADFVWILDMFDDLEVFPHNLATCSPVGAGELIFVTTSNGVDDSHRQVPYPQAPSLIAVDKKTGRVVWRRSDPGRNILHGQWSSPAYGLIGGQAMVVFGAGDGWCYAHAAETGRLIWKFDLNPEGAKWVVGGQGDRNSIVATPVIHDDKVYLAVGQDPDNGTGTGHLYCIDGTKTGDVTESGGIWHVGGEAFQRSLSTVAVADGLLYAVDLTGYLHCFDAATGRQHWVHDTFAGIWGSPYVVDHKVMIGTTDGEVLVLAHGKEKKLLATNDMRHTVYSTPVAANGVLYITNCQGLVAIEGPKLSEKAGPTSKKNLSQAGGTGPQNRGTDSQHYGSDSQNCGTGVSPVSHNRPEAWATVSFGIGNGTVASRPPSTKRPTKKQPTPQRSATRTKSPPGNWPMFRGNPQLTGVAGCDLPRRPVVLWRYDTGEVVQSSAAIVAGRVFVGCNNGSLYALDLASGALVWRYRTKWTDEPSGSSPPPSPPPPSPDEPGPAILSSPCVCENAVFFGDEDGVFHAVDMQTGLARWTFRTGAEIISSANHAPGRVLFGSYDAHLYCLSPADGKLLWKVETEGPVHAAPAVAGDHVAIAGCDARLRFVRLSDGSPVGDLDAGGRAAASPAFLGSRVFLGTLGNQVLGIAWVKEQGGSGYAGRRLWTYEHPERSFPFHASAAVTDRLVIIGGRDKMMHALDPETGKARWTFKAQARIDSSPVIVGSRVFFGSSDGNLYALNRESGRLVWKFEAGAPILASPAVGAGRLVIGTEDGVVYCFGERSSSNDT